jgi:DNA-binding transcriptional MerR regulator
LKDNLQRFLNIYNRIKKKGLSLEEIEEGIKRTKSEAVIDNELARKEKLSNELDEQIKEQKNIIANLKLEVQTLGMVKMIASKIVENLARERKRVELLSQYYAPRFGPQVNRYFIPISWKPI